MTEGSDSLSSLETRSDSSNCLSPSVIQGQRSRQDQVEAQTGHKQREYSGFSGCSVMDTGAVSTGSTYPVQFNPSADMEGAGLVMANYISGAVRPHP